MVVSRVSILRFTVIVLAAVGLPFLAAGQGRGGAVGRPGVVGRGSGAAVHAAPVPHPVGSSVGRAAMQAPSARVAQPRLPAAAARARATHRVNIIPRTDFSDFNDVPGLGFDFPHLAAINASRPHHGRRFGNTPFFDGFLLSSPSVVIEQPIPVEEEQVQPEETAAGNVVEEKPIIRHHRRMRESEVEDSAAPVSEPAPQREMDQFVFVRRDGSLVFAVAYTWVDGTLRYITPEGMRRTIARDALDLNATQQFNEQRGVSFRAPA